MIDHLNDPRVMIRFHLVMTAVWVLLIIPTFIWWKDSILWVLLISLYANVIGHFSAYQAVKAEQAIKEKDV